MKLESQVCSLDLAKRLKELGVKQESLFQWEDLGHRWGLQCRVNAPSVMQCAAFTVAELFEHLPETILVKGRKFVLVIGKDEVGYRNSESVLSPLKYNGGIFADRLAKMLIYLIEQGLVKP